MGADLGFQKHPPLIGYISPPNWLYFKNFSLGICRNSATSATNIGKTNEREKIGDDEGTVAFPTGGCPRRIAGQGTGYAGASPLEPLNDARTKLAAVFSSLLETTAKCD